MNNNNEHWHSDFGFTGPHTTFHRQHFQMVDLIIMNFKRTVYGLSLYAVTHEPVRCDNNMTEAKEERKETLEEDEWIQPKDHKARKLRNIEGKARHDEEEDMNGNRHHELHEEDLEDEENEGCLLRCNDEKREENSRNNEELT